MLNKYNPIHQLTWEVFQGKWFMKKESFESAGEKRIYLIGDFRFVDIAVIKMSRELCEKLVNKKAKHKTSGIDALAAIRSVIYQAEREERNIRWIADQLDELFYIP